VWVSRRLGAGWHATKHKLTYLERVNVGRQRDQLVSQSVDRDAQASTF
jgi:hypothetical protein